MVISGWNGQGAVARVVKSALRTADSRLSASVMIAITASCFGVEGADHSYGCYGGDVLSKIKIRPKIRHFLWIFSVRLLDDIGQLRGRAGGGVTVTMP